MVSARQAPSTVVGDCFRIMDDRDKDPTVVLRYLVGRPLAATEVYAAFGYRKSAYLRRPARAG
jgi:hypothetical protein